MKTKLEKKILLNKKTISNLSHFNADIIVAGNERVSMPPHCRSELNVACSPQPICVGGDSKEC
jgi:hypothetical protein